MKTGNAPQWFVYIILTDRATLYTGITTDVARRFRQHLAMYTGNASVNQLEETHEPTETADKDAKLVKVSKVAKAAKGAKYFRGFKPLAVVHQECCSNRAAASRREREIKKLSVSAKRALAGMD